MLEIGQDAIQDGLEGWMKDEEVREEYPTFSDYLTQLIGL